MYEALKKCKDCGEFEDGFVFSFCKKKNMLCKPNDECRNIKNGGVKCGQSARGS